MCHGLKHRNVSFLRELLLNVPLVATWGVVKLSGGDIRGGRLSTYGLYILLIYDVGR